MPQVRDRCHAERALGTLDDELVLAKHGEHGAEMAKVICPGRTIDQYVIKKHEYEPAKEDAQDIVHQCLKRSRGVAQPEWHHQELI